METDMKMHIEIPDDIRNILLDICEKMRLPPELTIEERCEFAIDALANSYDSAMPSKPEVMKEHEPLDMHTAINKALNPDISMEFTRDPKPMEELEADRMDAYFFKLEAETTDPN
jgi:hypothetical protein